jgi:1,4-dihydroxy-2-naphthoyl-CoA hydrolase
VVYFANVLALCHEAFEEWLMAAGIDLRSFFRSQVATPIVHAEIDFFKPLYCGDRVSIQVMPQPLSESEFEIRYEISCDRRVGKALTRHVCIDPATRTRVALPADLRELIR